MLQYDKYMIVVKVDFDGYEMLDVYVLIVVGFEFLKEMEFEFVVGFMVEVGIMGRGMRIVQVLKFEV